MAFPCPEYASAIADFQPLTGEEQLLASKEDLIQSYLKLAFKIAKQYNNLGTDISDLISEANVALVQAIEKWDRVRALTPYLVVVIENALKNVVSNLGLVRIPKHTRKQLKNTPVNVSEKRRKELVAAQAVKSVGSIHLEDGQIEIADKPVNIPNGLCLADIIKIKNKLHGMPRHLFIHFFKLNNRNHNLSISALSERYHLSIPKIKDIINQCFAFRTCKHCGAEFRASHARQIFCNTKCAKSYHDHARNKAQRIPPLSVQKCEWCEVSFKPKKQTQRFCSIKCSRCHRSFTKPEKVQTARSCRECGKVFIPDRGQRIYCSSTCADRNRRLKWEKRLPEKVCSHCLVVFRPKRRSQKFCSRSCGVIYNRVHSCIDK